MNLVDVKIITKCPPHGRCKMYSSVIWFIISTYRNVKITIIPQDFKVEADPSGPCVIINGKVQVPSNMVYVSGGDFISGLKEAGAIPYEGVEPDVKALNETIDSCTH